MFRILIVGLFLSSAAVAQESIPTDISQWFTNTAALAAVVAALIAFLRKHVLKNLDGLPVVGFSIVLGVALGYVGRLLGYLGADWLVFGLSAGLMASGGIDLLRGIARGKNAAAGDTDTDAARSRLR